MGWGQCKREIDWGLNLPGLRFEGLSLAACGVGLLIVVIFCKAYRRGFQGYREVSLVMVYPMKRSEKGKIEKNSYFSLI